MEGEDREREISELFLEEDLKKRSKMTRKRRRRRRRKRRRRTWHADVACPSKRVDGRRRGGESGEEDG